MTSSHFADYTRNLLKTKERREKKQDTLRSRIGKPSGLPSAFKYYSEIFHKKQRNY